MVKWLVFAGPKGVDTRVVDGTVEVSRFYGSTDDMIKGNEDKLYEKSVTVKFPDYMMFGATVTNATAVLSKHNDGVIFVGVPASNEDGFWDRNRILPPH